MDIVFIDGNEELLELIQTLWERLNKHHETISPHFKDEFSSFTFEQRKSNLRDKYKNSKLRVDLAKARDCIIGYCISGIDHDGVGEIESIYVLEEYQGSAIGSELMNRALAWLDEGKADPKLVKVAVGNEAVYRFYEKFGFFPRLITLKQKDHLKPPYKNQS